MLRKIIVALITGFVGLLFAMEFIPTIEGEVASENITNGIIDTIFSMWWLLPVGALLAIVLYGLRLIKK